MMCLKYFWMIGKQCRPRSDAAFCGIQSDLHCMLRLAYPNTWGIAGKAYHAKEPTTWFYGEIKISGVVKYI